MRHNSRWLGPSRWRVVHVVGSPHQGRVCRGQQPDHGTAVGRRCQHNVVCKLWPAAIANQRALRPWFRQRKAANTNAISTVGAQRKAQREGEAVRTHPWLKLAVQQPKFGATPKPVESAPSVCHGCSFCPYSALISLACNRAGWVKPCCYWNRYGTQCNHPAQKDSPAASTGGPTCRL